MAKWIYSIFSIPFCICSLPVLDKLLCNARETGYESVNKFKYNFIYPKSINLSKFCTFLNLFLRILILVF